MGKTDKINVISYYGSKAKLGKDMAEKLDYQYSEVYIEGFGGGASVLLNKPRHNIEIYNELDLGVYCLFDVLSKEDMAWELREQLFKVSYSKEEFNEALKIRNAYQDGDIKEAIRKLKLYIDNIEEKYGYQWFHVYELEYDNDSVLEEIESKMGSIPMNESEYLEARELIKDYEKCCNYTVEIKFIYNRVAYLLKQAGMYYLGKIYVEIEKKDGMLRALSYIFKNIQDNKTQLVRELKQQKKEETLKELRKLKKFYREVKVYPREILKKIVKNDNDKMELAKATFIVYNMSRDGLGKSFSNKKETIFYNKVEKLADAIERMKDVIVTNYDILELFTEDTLKQKFNLKNYDNSEIMIYLDPPYLKEGSLEDENESNKEADDSSGLLYKTGNFTVEKHKKLLKGIADKDYRMMVSNYRDSTSMYDNALTREKGWYTDEYETITTVGGKVGERTEVIWMNY